MDIRTNILNAVQSNIKQYNQVQPNTTTQNNREASYVHKSLFEEQIKWLHKLKVNVLSELFLYFVPLSRFETIVEHYRSL